MTACQRDAAALCLYSPLSSSIAHYQARFGPWAPQTASCIHGLHRKEITFRAELRKLYDSLMVFRINSWIEVPSFLGLTAYECIADVEGNCRICPQMFLAIFKIDQGHNIQRTPPASRQIITLENLSVPLSTFLKDTSVCIFSVGPSPCPFALQLDRANNSLPHIEGIDVGGPMNEANFQRAMRCHFSCRTEPFLVIHSIHSSISLLICSPVEG